MPPFGPIRRRELIATRTKLGFSGPYSGGKRQFMKRNGLELTIPNPHRGEIGPRLLAVVLRQAGISRAVWERT